MKAICSTALILAVILGSCTAKKTSDEAVEETVDKSAKYIRLKTGDEVFTLVCQNWEIEDADSPLPKDLFDRTENGTPHYPGLCFLTDSTIVENPRGEIRFGKFSLKGNQLTAKFTDGKSAEYSISRALPENSLLKRTEAGKVTKLKLTSEGVGYIDAKNNPFHAMYNQWRIKPSKPETDLELISRIKQNILFYAKYFQDHVDRDARSITFEGIPCCLTWYHGGITIKSESKLDEKWIDCFYTKSDAIKARNILEIALMKKHKWNTGISNWMEQMVPVLMSVRDSL